MSENSRPLSLPPGRAEGNWRWRCTEDMPYDRDFEWLRDLTKDSNRLGTLLNCGQETCGDFIH